MLASGGKKVVASPWSTLGSIGVCVCVYVYVHGCVRVSVYVYVGDVT